MSYILDALKRSEQQRSALPGQHNQADTSRVQHAGSRRFGIVAMLTVALLAGWGLAHLSNQSSEPTPTPSPAPSAAQSPAQEALSHNPDQESLPIPERHSVSSPSANHSDQTRSKPAAVTAQDTATSDKPTPAENSYAEPAFRPLAPDSPISRVEIGMPDLPVDPEPGAPAEDGIPALSELSPSIRQSIPAIDIQGHIYDRDPKQRMVILNGVVAREKQSVGNGLKLEEITRKGVIMSFQAHLFYLNVFHR